jgi:hypothetical protein
MAARFIANNSETLSQRRGEIGRRINHE